jgi:aconitate hydratase 2/2-methylisocitrate dehydratase
MDKDQLFEEFICSFFDSAGAHTEMLGCSFCMGKQAHDAPGYTVFLTSTRKFPNRLGQGSDLCLARAELAAVA